MEALHPTVGPAQLAPMFVKLAPFSLARTAKVSKRPGARFRHAPKNSKTSHLHIPSLPAVRGLFPRSSNMALIKPWVKTELDFILQFNESGQVSSQRTKWQTKKQHVQCVEVDAKRAALKINDSKTMVWCFVSRSAMKTVSKGQTRLRWCLPKCYDAEFVWCCKCWVDENHIASCDALPRKIQTMPPPQRVLESAPFPFLKKHCLYKYQNTVSYY